MFTISPYAIERHNDDDLPLVSALFALLPNIGEAVARDQFLDLDTHAIVGHVIEREVGRGSWLDRIPLRWPARAY